MNYTMVDSAVDRSLGLKHGLGMRISPAVEDEVRSLVSVLIGKSVSPQAAADRRNDQRFPYPHLVHLTPVDDEGLTPVDETIVVVGKHLSLRGLDFYHNEPLSHRRMIASIESNNGKKFHFLLDLSWCRFIGHGWYGNGGRFMKVVDAPFSHFSN